VRRAGIEIEGYRGIHEPTTRADHDDKELIGEANSTLENPDLLDAVGIESRIGACHLLAVCDCNDAGASETHVVFSLWPRTTKWGMRWCGITDGQDSIVSP